MTCLFFVKKLDNLLYCSSQQIPQLKPFLDIFYIPHVLLSHSEESPVPLSAQNCLITNFLSCFPPSSHLRAESDEGTAFEPP